MEACISVRGDLFSAVAQSGARRRRKLFLMNTVNAVNASLVFTQCVETINRGHDGNYQQANRWLSEFKYDPNAWGTLVDLINQSSNSDVLFHAANIANSKAKNEWSNINDDVRRSLVQVVRGKLATPAAAAMPHFVAERLCLAQATMTCLSGAQDTEQLLQGCIGPLQQDGPARDMALRMVRTVAERIPDLDPGSRTRLAPVIVHFSVPLLQGLCRALQQSAAEQQAAVIDTLTSWLQAIPWDSKEPPVPSKDIGAACLTAMPLLVVALSTTSSRPSAGEALTFIVEGNDFLFQDNELPVMTSITDHLTGLVTTVSSGGCRSDRGRAAPMLTSIATVASDATYNCTDLVQRVELARLIAALVEHVPHRGATYATAVAEVLFSVNCTTVESRCRELGPEMFVAAVERVLPEAMYPEGFTRWEEMDAPDGDDELGDYEFKRFRDDEVCTLLQIAYDHAGFGFLARMVAATPHSMSWQAVEVVAFAVNCTAPSLIKTLAEARKQEAMGNMALRREATQINDALALFFSVATGSHRQLVLTNEYLLAITCTALGSCSKWLSSRRDAALANAVALVMGAAVSGQPPRVSPEACTALKWLCSEQVPADVLPLTDVVNGICSCIQSLCALTPNADSDGLEETARIKKGGLAVAEAGARLTCRLLDFRLSPQSQSVHACALAAPPLAVLSAASQNATAQNMQQLKVCLSILSTIIRFLEDPSSSDAHHQSCVVAAIEKSWPVLQALAACPLGQNSVVSSGVSEVVSAAFSAAGEQRGALISPSCNILQQLFSANVSAAPLECVAKLAELSGEGSGVTPEQQGVLHQGLVGFVREAHTATLLPNQSQPDVIAAMLTVLARWACFHPLALLAGGLLDSALAVTTGATCMRERAVVQNSLAFLTLLMTPNRMLRELAAEHAEQAALLGSAVAAHADRMVCALLTSLCDPCPWDSWRSMGRVMFYLLTSAASCEQAVPAAQRELTGGNFVAYQGSPLSQNDCQRFAGLCLKAVALQERRFTAAVMDFAKIAHGQGDSDSLLAYEM